MSVINRKCSFCDNYADVLFGSNPIPACMRCVDIKLNENLNKIDREKNEKIHQNLLRLLRI